MFLTNPYQDKDTRKSRAELLKLLKSEINYNQYMQSGKLLNANTVLDIIDRADPTRGAYRAFLVQTFIYGVRDQAYGYSAWVEDTETLAKDTLEIYMKGQRSGAKGRNEPWAEQALLGQFQSINEMRSYLVDEGLISTEFEGDWIKSALALQKTGDCFLLEKAYEDGSGNRWVFVDLITNKSSCSLGENSGWCTASGAFYNYLPNSGLVMIYCVDTGERLQITSSANADELERYDKDGHFVEQKAANNVVFKFTGALKPLLEPAKKFAKIVQKRAKLTKGFPLRKTLQNYINGGNKFTGDFASLDKAYKGKCNFPPLLAVKRHSELLRTLVDFQPSFSQSGFVKKDGAFKKAMKAYEKLNTMIPTNALLLELCATKNWIAFHVAVLPVLQMVKIPAGTYRTLTAGDDNRHAYVRAFEVCKFEVTAGLWAWINGEQGIENVTQVGSVYNPQADVNWYDCVRFCNALSKEFNLQPCYDIGSGSTPTVEWKWDANGFRLPTEAEWEIAAREPPLHLLSEKALKKYMENRTADAKEFKGIKTPSGDPYWQIDYTYAGSNEPDPVAWYSDNADGRAHPVGEKKPNGWGLFDMSGNLYEWCFDTYSDDPTDKEDGEKLAKKNKGFV